MEKWNDKWIELAIKVMSVGGSAERVAKAINHVFGANVTRNSVIGRIHRMKKAGDTRFDNLPPPEKMHGKSIQFLIEAWENGISSMEIGDYYGIHRNTVGKKAVEYGLDPRSENTFAIAKKIKREFKKKKNSDEPKISYKPFKASNKFPNSKALGLSLVEVGHLQCRFVVGDGPFLFCGQPVEPGSGSSYCHLCHKVVYVPTQPKTTLAVRV